MRENGIKRGVGGGRVGGWAERGKKQGWYRGKKVGSCGNCRGRGAGGRELCSLRTVVEGKAGVDRARRVNLSIRGSMGMREGGGGRMVQGPKGSKRRKIRPRSGRSMASEEGRSCDRPLQRANRVSRVVHRWCARCNVERDRTGDIGAKYTRKGREKERKRKRERDTRLFSVISG